MRKALEEEIQIIRSLDIGTPKFDATKTFEGLARQKIEKKDRYYHYFYLYHYIIITIIIIIIIIRHMKALDNFAQLLETISEQLEQELLDRRYHHHIVIIIITIIIHSYY